MDNIDQAAELVIWLMTKDRKRNVAIAIACNKYKIPFSYKPVVNKRVSYLKKHPKNQMELL